MQHTPNWVELIKIGEFHIYQALAYMSMPYIPKTDNGIRYVRGQHAPYSLAICYNGERYAHREVLRVAYLFATDEKVSEETGLFSEDQIKKAQDNIMVGESWDPIGYHFWPARGFVVKNIKDSE